MGLCPTDFQHPALKFAREWPSWFSSSTWWCLLPRDCLQAFIPASRNQVVYSQPPQAVTLHVRAHTLAIRHKQQHRLLAVGCYAWLGKGLLLGTEQAVWWVLMWMPGKPPSTPAPSRAGTIWSYSHCYNAKISSSGDSWELMLSPTNHSYHELESTSFIG